MVLDQHDLTKLTQILSSQHNAPEATGAPYLGNADIDQQLFLKQNIADAKMSALMSQTLAQKEKIISELEKELLQEQKRRKDIKHDYQSQVKEIESDMKAIERLKRQSDMMEKA